MITPTTLRCTLTRLRRERGCVIICVSKLGFIVTKSLKRFVKLLNRSRFMKANLFKEGWSFMLSQLDLMAFEQERTMPYAYSPYPEIEDPKEAIVQEAREKVAQLQAFIRENEIV